MPFKSKSQMRRFGHLLKEGKMTQEEYDKWAEGTPSMDKLPERTTTKKYNPIVKVRKPK